jgi:hypothetical protein
MGRKPLGERAMMPTERQQRHRQNIVTVSPMTKGDARRWRKPCGDPR